MNKGDSAHLARVLRVARSIRTFVRNIDPIDFQQDLMRRSAVVSQLISLGMTVKQLSGTAKAAYPEIPWAMIEAFSESLLRDYDTIHPDDVLHVSRTLIPTILEEIDRIGPLSQER
jgi:uncharacterized protein with HEPN domain